MEVGYWKQASGLKVLYRQDGLPSIADFGSFKSTFFNPQFEIRDPQLV
jgi:hypothetical protein